jgi:hypothetical protein
MAKRFQASRSGNKITKALNQITPKTSSSKTNIPKLQPTNVGNMGDSAPVSKMRKGMF